MTGPSFTDLRQRLAQDVPQGRCDEIGVRRLWWAALETLQQDLLAVSYTHLTLPTNDQV